MFNNPYKNRLKAILTGIGIIFFWRGAWHSLDYLFDEVFFKNQVMIGNGICIVIGLVVIIWVNYDNF